MCRAAHKLHTVFAPRIIPPLVCTRYFEKYFLTNPARIRKHKLPKLSSMLCASTVLQFPQFVELGVSFVKNLTEMVSALTKSKNGCGLELNQRFLRSGGFSITRKNRENSVLSTTGCNCNHSPGCELVEISHRIAVSC